MSNKKDFDMNDIDSTIGTTCKPSSGINWDAIQRMRFMNADAEIDPEDSYSKGKRTFNED